MAQFGIGVIISLLLIYFLPTIVALIRRKSNSGAIFALNLFLGWTLIGWVVSLVWALTKDNKPQTIIINTQASADETINPIITNPIQENLQPVINTPAKPTQVNEEYNRLFNNKTWFQKNKDWIVGLLIVLVIGLILILFKAYYSNKTYTKTYVENGNIFVKNSDEVSTQITFQEKDTVPLISPDKTSIYFIRKTGNFGDPASEDSGVEQLAIMKIDLSNLKEEKITDTIRHVDWRVTNNLYEVTNFSLSEDGQFLFFITQKWAVSGVLVKLNTKTKETTELTPCDEFELLNKGEYKNHIIATRSSIKDNDGREWSNWLIDFDGNSIKEIGNEKAVRNFKIKTNSFDEISHD